MGRYLNRKCDLCEKRRAGYLVPDIGMICKYCWNEQFKPGQQAVIEQTTSKIDAHQTVSTEKAVSSDDVSST